jgi:hypothetical protein
VLNGNSNDANGGTACQINFNGTSNRGYVGNNSVLELNGSNNLGGAGAASEAIAGAYVSMIWGTLSIANGDYGGLGAGSILVAGSRNFSVGAY